MQMFLPFGNVISSKVLSSKIHLAAFKRSPKLYTITHPRCLLTARLTRASALALSVLTIPHLLRWAKMPLWWLTSDCQLFLAYPWFYHHHKEKPRLKFCICLLLESLPLLFSLQPNMIRLKFKGSNQAKSRGFTYMSKPRMSNILIFNSLLSDNAENFLLLRLRYRRWMVSKSGWSGWRSNWRNQGRSTDRTRLLLLLTLLLQRTRGETEENNSILFLFEPFLFWIFPLSLRGIPNMQN